MAIIGKPVEILLVEDNEGDVGLIEEVFEEMKIRRDFLLFSGLRFSSSSCKTIKF